MKKLFLFLFFISGIVCSAAGLIEARQAFFRDIEKNPAALRSYLDNSDPEIRRYALYRIVKSDPLAALPVIEKALQDADEQVRLTAVSALPPMVGKDARVAELLRKAASQDASKQVRKIAVQATWPFYREIKLLRNDPTWDYEVKTVRSLPLTHCLWRFAVDPMQQGHLKGYFRSDFNVSDWKIVKMGSWEAQGFADYDGVAWYQIKFNMPEKMDCNAVEIAFEGVDESAWVWLNGVYLGAHDIGPEGWKEPFAVDCRKEILWGRENVLTVRVFDAAYAGGIYKPVRVDILK